MEKLFPDLFLKNQDWAYPWINSNVLYSLFLLYSKLRAREIYWNKAADHLLLSHTDFLKIKSGQELVSLPHFLHDFWKKMFLLLYFINLTKFHCLIVFTSWDNKQYVYCNCLLTRLSCHKFWNNPDLSNQAVFSKCPKSQDKI